MKISKKGFTLTEIIIVVAIIVIISGAAIAGVAVTIAQANERGEQMYNLYGEGNWEKEANATIAALKPTLGDEKTYEADVKDSTGGDTEDDDKLDPNPTPDPDPKDPDPKDPDPKNPDPKDPDPKDPDPKTDPEPDPVVNSTGVTANSGATLTSTSSSGVVLKDYTSQWGSGSVKIHNNNDMQSYDQLTITIDVEKSGKINFNGKDYQVSPGTNTIVITNGTNPYWTDPNFSQGSDMTMYFNFGNSDGQDYQHGMSINVEAS